MFEVSPQAIEIDQAARRLASPAPLALPAAETSCALPFGQGYLHVRVRHDGAGSVTVRFSASAQEPAAPAERALYYGLHAGREVISYRPGVWAAFLVRAARRVAPGKPGPSLDGGQETGWQEAA